MADVKITFEEVKTKANEIHTCNVNLDQALKDIKTNITSLDAQWTSDASDTIRGKINGMQSKFQTYYDIIESYVEFLNTTGADEEETTTIDEKDAGVLLLSQYAVDIKVGDQYKIEAKDVPKEYDKKPIIWESEDTSVATISSKGVIDAKKAGKTTIYGRTEDGKYIGKCIVLVRD